MFPQSAPKHDVRFFLHSVYMSVMLRYFRIVDFLIGTIENGTHVNTCRAYEYFSIGIIYDKTTMEKTLRKKKKKKKKKKKTEGRREEEEEKEKKNTKWSLY